MKQPRSLFARTGATLTAGLLVFLVLTIGVMLQYILVPLGKLATDDFAAIMVLSAQTWTELPPETRPDFELELLEKYQLKLSAPDTRLPPSRNPLPYLHFLRTALQERTGEPVTIRAQSGQPPAYCVDIPAGGRIIRISFPRSRIGTRPPMAALLVIAAGAMVILLTTLFLVRRLTAPLTRLSEATSRIGRGEMLQALPETGPAEIATLTRNFNRMSRQIAELLASRTTLFAGISHDLRTPITRMQLALEMLQPAADPELLNRLQQDLASMNRLIHESLELARGLESREPEETDLREFIDGMVSDYRRGEADIRWSPDHCCFCSVDTLALRRVLGNVIDNAVRYGAGKPVTVECACHDRGAIIRIIDRGPGIPEAEREAVFRPFYRLETSRNRTSGGSGLGLAIARQLCDAQGWTIRLLANEAGGSRVELHIPRAADPDIT